MAEELLRVQDVVKHFELPGVLLGASVKVRALDGVSLVLHKGESLGVVGESGCGKTTLSRVILRLLAPTSGQLFFKGADITHLHGRQLRHLRRAMQVVFQDPYGSLNPRMRVREILGEPLRVHFDGSTDQCQALIVEIAHLVGLGEEALDRYPHEFSGGQRQRIAIARALILRPDIVVADEPVSALDVSIRAQILNLLKTLQARLSLSYIFVSHDIGAVRFLCQTVIVMYLGRVVEEGPAEEVFRRPAHPYTIALMASVPSPAHADQDTPPMAMGEVPSPISPPSGCHFHPRCPHRMPVCSDTVPALLPADGGRRVACHLVPARVSAAGSVVIEFSVPQIQPNHKGDLQ